MSNTTISQDTTQTTTSDINTELSGHIVFHGVALLVVVNNGIEYIPAKPLAVDIAETDWKTARNKLFNGDNPQLFGTKTLFDPVINAKKGAYAPKKQVYIRLDR